MGLHCYGGTEKSVGERYRKMKDGTGHSEEIHVHFAAGDRSLSGKSAVRCCRRGPV